MIPRARRVDWDVIFGDEIPAPRIMERRAPPPQLSTLLPAAMGASSAASVDRLLRHAVELGRLLVPLERAAIFLVDEKNGTMVGTWGTDDRGETVDEHHIMYAFGGCDQAVFDRARRGLPWTVYENCPWVTQLEHETRILGKGWVACTAIHGPRGPIGILFNDAALTHAPVDEAKQARAAMLCTLLGQALDRGRRQESTIQPRRSAALHPVVHKVTSALAEDPTLTCDELARRVHLSAGRLARIFKKETSMSVVDHRNEVRLARFLDRVDVRGGNLLSAALDAGFGSYAQFHRVFSARFHQTPRAYLSLPSQGAPETTGNERPHGSRG